MPSPKKKVTAKASVKFKDLKSKKNPKGGAFDTYIKFSPTKSVGWLKI
jgi:hypothetical protein